MPPRICLAVHRFPPFLGGCEKYAYNLAEGLSNRGFEITVYTTRHEDRYQKKFGLEIRNFQNINLPRSGYYFWPGAFSPKIIRELRKFDLFHAIDFNMFSPLVGFVAKKIYKTPTVLTATYHPPFAMVHHKLKTLYDRTVGKHILDEYDIIIVHSELELKSLMEHVGQVNPEKIRKIPHGLSLDTKPQRSFRTLYKLNGDFIVLYVGRIELHKGIEDVLRAISHLITEGDIKNLKFVIVGQKERWYKCPSPIQKLINDLGDKVILTGKISSEILASAYLESNVMVLPSKYETFGYVLLEALNYGTPVISTKVGIAPELIVDGFNGFLYEYGDVLQLMSKLRCAYEKGKEIRKHALESVNRFSLDKEIEETVNVYKSLLET